MITIQTDVVKWGVVIPESDGIDGGNERCIEWPLGIEAMACAEPGWVLDAGCAMVRPVNAAPDHLAPIAHIVHLTQAIGDEPIKPRGRQMSFVSADLRDLHVFADRAFDRVVCISTLEHVGFDNSQYGGTEEYDSDAWMMALRELWRVTKRTLLITVPYHHQSQQCSKWRYFTPNHLVTARHLLEFETVYYARGQNGWHGGGSTPLAPDWLLSFPEKVNQIVCLRATK